jgi:hypothetical protein
MDLSKTDFGKNESSFLKDRNLTQLQSCACGLVTLLERAFHQVICLVTKITTCRWQNRNTLLDIDVLKQSNPVKRFIPCQTIRHWTSRPTSELHIFMSRIFRFSLQCSVEQIQLHTILTVQLVEVKIMQS